MENIHFTYNYNNFDQMKYTATIILAALLGVSYCTPSDHWAVIVAGSNTYSNYRH